MDRNAGARAQGWRQRFQIPRAAGIENNSIRISYFQLRHLRGVTQAMSHNRHPEIQHLEHKRRFDEVCKLWDRAILNVKGVVREDQLF